MSWRRCGGGAGLHGGVGDRLSGSLAPQDYPVAGLWGAESLWGRCNQNCRVRPSRLGMLHHRLGRRLSQGLRLHLDQVALRLKLG